MKSLRKQVFEFIDGLLYPDIQLVYEHFKGENKITLEGYFYQWKRMNKTDISNNIELINLDTIREMELAINQIKDPVKRCENLSRLHAMKLRPLKNLNAKTLKELLDG